MNDLGPSAPAAPAAASAPAPAAGKPAPRFCERCGAPWDPAWTECSRCRQDRAASGSEPAPRNGSLGPALLLYAVLLGCSAVLLGVEASWRTVNVVSGLQTILVLGWVAVRFRGELRQGLVRSGSVAWYPLAAAASIATFLIAVGSIALQEALYHAPVLNVVAEFRAEGLGWGALVLFTCVEPALTEELVFRGVVMDGLASVLRPRESIVVAALMFMVLHLSAPNFPHLLVMGLALGWLRVRSGSIYPGMVLHFSHNLLCVLDDAGRLG